MMFLNLFGIVAAARTNPGDNYFIDMNSDRLDQYYAPSIFIPIFVRNKAHALPYFLGGIENLNYPKTRIKIWFVTDHNEDGSLSLIQHWAKAWETNYAEIKVEVREPRKGYYTDAQTTLSWSKSRYDHILKLRQEAIEKARKMWCDYLFFVDADNILLYGDLLLKLIKRNKLVVAPMLETGYAFSNYWSDQNLDTGYYERGDDYYDIKEYTNVSVHEVPVIHSCYLIDMNRWKSERIQYYPRISEYQHELPNWPLDDIIYFTGMARIRNVDLYVDNSHWYGWFPYPIQSGELPSEIDQFIYTLMEIITQPPVGWDTIPPASYAIPIEYPVPNKLESYGIDEIYMINLERRKDRMQRMDFCFRLLGLDYKLFPAVDGKELGQQKVDELGIKQLEGFSDPHHPRKITRGEVGCFLSHYYIWQECVENNYDMIIILEDDVRFKPNFMRDLKMLLYEVKNSNLDWDLIYLGRKRGPGAQNDVEKRVTDLLVTATYSYWTIGYILSGRGARSLIEEEPLSKMVPVDEYLPIMYGAHKESKYAQYFSNKNLKAFSADPLLLTPTHYTGQMNYYTDTEPEDSSDILFKDEL